MASWGSLGSDVLDIATWLNHNGLQVTSIRSLRKLHVALPSWSMSLWCPTWSPINSSFPFLTLSLSHIFFLDISRPSRLI